MLRSFSQGLAGVGQACVSFWVGFRQFWVGVGKVLIGFGSALVRFCYILVGLGSFWGRLAVGFGPGFSCRWEVWAGFWWFLDTTESKETRERASKQQ